MQSTRRFLGNLISVAYSFVRLFVLGLINRNVKSKVIERISPSVVIEVGRQAGIFLGEKVRIHSGTKIKVRGNGRLSLGNNVKINYNCMVIVHEKVNLGSNVELGPNVLIYDHDHDFREKDGLKNLKYKTSPVEIGENTWVGANTVILRGTKIGKNCVIGAGSVIKGEFPDNSVIIQRRVTSVIPYEFTSESKVDKS